MLDILHKIAKHSKVYEVIYRCQISNDDDIILNKGQANIHEVRIRLKTQAGGYIVGTSYSSFEEAVEAVRFKLETTYGGE